VWISEDELQALASELGMAPSDFRSGSCRSVGSRTSLRERADGDCVLLGPEGCLVYAARPVQCRTFPFWPENLCRPADWERLARDCPGLNRGRRYSLKEIRESLALEKGGACAGS
jgi:Fe-S-cluster containining protein